MRLVDCFFAFIVAAFVCHIAVAQDVPSNLRLHINNDFEQVELCSAEQATEFYISLHGYQRQIKKIAGVKDGETLDEWYLSYNDWYRKEWGTHLDDNYCHGIEYLILMLSPYTAYSVIEGIIGEFGPKPAQDVMSSFLEMAASDFTSMAQDDFDVSELRINHLITDLPLCSDERAIEFYDNLEGYAGKVNQLGRVKSWHTLKLWLVVYRSWHGKAWESFYEEPCGGSLMFIHWLESEAYWAGLDQVTVGRNWLTETIGAIRGQADADIALIEENSIE